MDYDGFAGGLDAVHGRHFPKMPVQASDLEHSGCNLSGGRIFHYGPDAGKDARQTPANFSR